MTLVSHLVDITQEKNYKLSNALTAIQEYEIEEQNYRKKLMNAKFDQDGHTIITDVPGTISQIPQQALSSQGLEETQTRSSPEEEVTLSISEHIGSNTILFNVIMNLYFHNNKVNCLN